ncbi:MAG: alpha/beta hydrolase [Lachnospiraceae bacterium]|nr:alpha/beta hydrolase [Lachnospiraceae bacterium]
MSENLIFPVNQFEVKTCERDGQTICYRSFENITYCANPKHDIQKLNLFVPEIFYEGACINGYDLKTAPIFIPNTVGGYMEGPTDVPGVDFLGRTNTIFKALQHGYVVVAPGIRGRNTGLVSKEFFVGGTVHEEADDAPQKAVGRAPALIIDMKAVVRYLRHNKEVIPGNTERIITSGTSAGGALSALTGATGNAKDYEPYLKEIGAADERDDIFAANCYCPIHNLDHADAAYEWLFCGHNEYHKIRFEHHDGHVAMIPVNGIQTDTQIALSKELKQLFPAYVNSLALKDFEGNELALDSDGEGSFKDYIKMWLLKSAQKELDTHDSGVRLKDLAVPGSEIDDQDYLTVENGKVVDLDWDRFVTKITRMKTTPAFDAVDLNSPENEEFGDENVFARHFTEFSQAHDTAGGEKASDEMIRLLNPTMFIGKADTTKHWRIRHGAFDRDTSLAIPTILATLLQNHGYDVDFALPWGLPHSGDYDIDDLFAWIDKLCQADA